MKMYISFSFACIAVALCNATSKSNNQGQAAGGYRSTDTANNAYEHEQILKNKAVSNDGDFSVASKKSFTYQGRFEGLCGNDGFYYNDRGSFVICSNNNAYMQPCAPGSRNSGLEKYNPGENYLYRDFCDVNLVDRGYGVRSGYEDVRQRNSGKPSRHADSGYGLESYNAKQAQEASYKQQYIYHGKYEGQCGKDGFYYRDQDSFVICSNNNAYEQPCAPGSRNSGFENYKYGGNYNYRDFCDVNLVDHGYGVKDRYGYNHRDQKGH